MFNAISWQGYWTAMALIATFYYAFILFFYYGQDVSSWLQKKKVSQHKPVPATLFEGFRNHPVQPFLFDAAADFQTPPSGTEEHIVYACMDELTAFFTAAKSRRWTRPELLQAIGDILSKYPSIKQSEYSVSMGHVIATQCEQYCSIHLKAEEVVGLW